MQRDHEPGSLVSELREARYLPLQLIDPRHFDPGDMELGEISEEYQLERLIQDKTRIKLKVVPIKSMNLNEADLKATIFQVPAELMQVQQEIGLSFDSIPSLKRYFLTQVIAQELASCYRQFQGQELTNEQRSYAQQYMKNAKYQYLVCCRKVIQFQNVPTRHLRDLPLAQRNRLDFKFIVETSNNMVMKQMMVMTSQSLMSFLKESMRFKVYDALMSVEPPIHRKIGVKYVCKELIRRRRRQEPIEVQFIERQ